MLKHPTETSAETIRGDPSHHDTDSAVQEFRKLMSSGFGQPYLIAVKLRDEPSTLHLRVQIENPDNQFKWADLDSAPPVIRELAADTSNRSAVASRLFKEGEEPKLYFDPAVKGNPWSVGTPATTGGPEPSGPTQKQLPSKIPEFDSDLLAERLPESDEQVSQFKSRIDEENYEVPDATMTVKTRGSAQKAFADKVKNNYGWRCSLTGIRAPEFLIASHIVPWSVDQTIRLDPANGICLSVFIDRAFEKGFLIVQDDMTVTVNFGKIADDIELKKQLEGYDGMKLNPPKANPPKVDYLKCRRSL
jgi:hypothetical protein